MLLPYTTLTYYGPCATAVYLDGVGSVTAQPVGSIRSASSLSGAGTITYARSLRLIGSPATLLGSGTITVAQPRGYIRANVTIKVNELSQDDVSGAVWQSFVSPGITYQAAIQTLLAGGGGGGATASDIWSYSSRSLTDVSNIQSGLATSAEVADLPTDTADAVWSKTLP